MVHARVLRIFLSVAVMAIFGPSAPVAAEEPALPPVTAASATPPPLAETPPPLAETPDVDEPDRVPPCVCCCTPPPPRRRSNEGERTAAFVVGLSLLTVGYGVATVYAFGSSGPHRSFGLVPIAGPIAAASASDVSPTWQMALLLSAWAQAAGALAAITAGTIPDDVPERPPGDSRVARTGVISIRF